MRLYFIINNRWIKGAVVKYSYKKSRMRRDKDTKHQALNEYGRIHKCVLKRNA